MELQEVKELSKKENDLFIESQAEKYMEEGYDIKDSYIMAKEDLVRYSEYDIIDDEYWEEYDHQDKEDYDG
jgi:hypothetical protein